PFRSRIRVQALILERKFVDHRPVVLLVVMHEEPGNYLLVNLLSSQGTRSRGSYDRRLGMVPIDRLQSFRSQIEEQPVLELAKIRFERVARDIIHEYDSERTPTCKDQVVTSQLVPRHFVVVFGAFFY